MFITKHSSCRKDNTCPLQHLACVCFQQAFKPIMMLYTYGSIDKRGQMFEIYVMLLICCGVIQLLILNPLQRLLACCMRVYVDP